MNTLSAVKSGEKQITGSSKTNFGYLESTNGEIDFSIVKNIICNGHHNGKVLYIIRNYADKNVCHVVADKFNHMVAENGGNRPDDGYVLTYQVGATQVHTRS